MMKTAFVMSVALLLLCGCGTFGTFANLKKGDTTTAEVRSMLGEPENIRFETDGEVWEYRFVKQDRLKNERLQTTMNLALSFKEGVVESYEVAASKSSVPAQQEDVSRERRPIPQPVRQPSEQKRPTQQTTSEPAQPQTKEAENFMNQFDKNSDGRVSREEFLGPSDAFNQMDKNRDGYIDESEVLPPPQQHRMDQRGRGNQR